MRFQSAEKPDSTILFLKNQGFTHAQVLRMARKFPPIIESDPETILRPKIEFFRALGFPNEEINEMFYTRPEILRRSLEEQLRPSFEFVIGLIPSGVKEFCPLKGYARILCCDFETCLVPYVEILREFGVPNENIVSFLKIQSRAFQLNASKFRKIVEEVKEMGFNPLRFNFVLAIHAIQAMNKSTWEKKLEMYKKWGYSYDEICKAFVKNPWCMIVSMDKIMRIMDFLVNKMGFESSLILKTPGILTFSLQKRIIPRCIVYQAVSGKALLPKGNSVTMMLMASEEAFLKKFVEPFEAQAPELLMLYQKNMHLST